MDKMKDEIVKQHKVGKEGKLADTPGYPGRMLEKSAADVPKIFETESRSTVEKLQCHQTKIGPKILNSTRELSTHLQHPGEEGWKSMGRLLVGFLKLKKTFKLTSLRSPEELRSMSLCDSNYTQCDETR
jgi:hypothetical protein